MRAIFAFSFFVALGSSAIADEETVESLPRPMELAGLHAYAEKIVSAGDQIHFRVSSTCRFNRLPDQNAHFVFP